MNEIEKAIAYLKDSKKYAEKNSRNLNDAKEVQNIINTAIEALEKQLNNGWISTVEKLPDKGGYYLVSTKCETPRVMIGFYFKDLNLWNYWMSTLEIKSVIAWQPLPEQYKEDETNELR